MFESAERDMDCAGRAQRRQRFSIICQPHLPIIKFAFSVLCFSLIAGCATAKPPERHAWVTGLKPDQAAHYEELHQHVWPGVTRTIKVCHIQNFSIYEREIDGKLYLFAYLEYTGTDFDADMKRMAADPETQRWWQQTDPCQLPLPDAAAKGQIWSDAKEVYYHP